jgi:hypothetical protein
MRVRHLIALAVLLLASAGAQACLFATKTPPEGWYQWASMLFAAEVTEVARDPQRPVDVVTARVVETFKGTEVAGAGTLTVSLSNRYWTNCKVEQPAAGARVLVAMNANGEALLVPLTASFAEALRAFRKGSPAPFPEKGS